MENSEVNELMTNLVQLQDRTVKMVALRGIVVFPGQTVQFDLVRDKSIVALTKAYEHGEEVFLVAQKNPANISPSPKDIYRIGTLAKVSQIIRLPNDSLRAVVIGKERKEIGSYVSLTPFFEVTIKDCCEKYCDSVLVEAAKRKVVEQLELYKAAASKFPAELENDLGANNLRHFIGLIAMFVIKDVAVKQRLLQHQDDYSRLEEIYAYLVKELEIMTIERKIASKVRSSIDKNQREYYLREQLKAIHDELGDNTDELEEFRLRAASKKLPEPIMEKIEKEIIRLEKMSPMSAEAGVSRTYIEWVLDLPWNESADESTDLVAARGILDEDHFGLEKVKDRIIEYLAVHLLTKKLKGPILCFVGPPGVGKTSIVQSIARASERPLVSVSLGGVRDEAEIRGHRRTYIGALPGRIINGMKLAKAVNPVFLLDEIDKMSSDFRGDPTSAMLEVLDPNQNSQFKDHYLEVPFDLSKVMFIATANTVETIPSPLLDRMEVIHLSGYTYNEKLQIAKKFLLPKQLTQSGLSESLLTMTDEAINEIIIHYTRESGVRNLEREISTVIRKVALNVVNSGGIENAKPLALDKGGLTEYLGPIKYFDEVRNETDEVGSAKGLAWTLMGGTTLDIEVALIPDGKGEVTLTGSLGDVMKESCQAAMTVVKSRAKAYGADSNTLKTHDIHIHLPEGATPKDGPSAGITMATAIMSAISGKKVNRDVAMTGEITLRGKVLAIGGLKEKSLAAYRAGIKRLLIPIDNEKDIREIPQEVKDSVEIVCVSTIDNVFDCALL